MAEYFTLQEICSKSDFVLIDTCSFLAPSSCHADKNSPIEKKIEKEISSNENLSFLIEKIPLYKNIYSTDGIIDEIKHSGYKYNKSIKLPFRGTTDKVLLSKLRRERSQNKKNRVNLTNILELGNRIFKMDGSQKEIYDFFYEKYSSFIGKFGVSKEDLDLLLLGGVLSKENVASIISNDGPLKNCWKIFLNGENYLRDRFYFYSNPDVNFFKKA
jgi:hypothetical protein